ncbi:MAG: hypothetical protein KGI00_02785 [Candidatus Micrarchaeota archaeon]|nr:hypothetical protein [Candidatus Micrarchaeota archaeon]MDE1849633.1 hypothetical protein [Candidatus Micrarchaeota archaeon]
MASKKKHPTFAVPNLGAKGRSRVKDRWRKQRGTDNKLRVKAYGHGNTPNIGYKNSDSIRNARPDGTMEMLVHNVSELMMLKGKSSYSAVLFHGLSSRKRMEMQKLADENRIRITNRMR